MPIPNYLTQREWTRGHKLVYLIWRNRKAHAKFLLRYYFAVLCSTVGSTLTYPCLSNLFDRFSTILLYDKVQGSL